MVWFLEQGVSFLRPNEWLHTPKNIYRKYQAKHIYQADIKLLTFIYREEKYAGFYSLSSFP